jgi:hypothetical protein
LYCFIAVRVIERRVAPAGWLLALTEQLQSKRKNDGE